MGYTYCSRIMYRFTNNQIIYEDFIFILQYYYLQCRILKKYIKMSFYGFKKQFNKTSQVINRLKIDIFITFSTSKNFSSCILLFAKP